MKMSLYSTVSAAVLLACGVPAMADVGPSGVGQLYISQGSTDGSFFSGKLLDSPLDFGGKVQQYWPLSGEVHLQVDLFAQHEQDLFHQLGTFSDGRDSSRFGGAVHVLHPLDDRARFGVAGSIWGADVYPIVSSVTFLRKTRATYGLIAGEAQFFDQNWTLSGQAGVFSAFSCDSCFGTIDGGTYLRGKVKYFLHDNTVLSLEGQHMWGSIDDSIFSGKSLRARSTLWTLEAEHRFADSSFSGFIDLSQQSDEFTGIIGSTADTQTVRVGVRFYWDQDTLKSTDRTGAAMDTPQFGNLLETAGGQAAATVFGFGGP